MFVNHKDINKFDTKDLLIRDVPTYVLNKVDEISNARNLSRNEFLNIYLRQLTYSNSLKLVDEKYKYMLEKSLGILDFNNRNARNLSRNEFLNIYLRQLTYSNSLKLVDEKYKYMLEKSLGILDFNNRIFKIFYDENIVDISHFIEGSL